MKSLTKRQFHQFIAIFAVFAFCGASSYDMQNVANMMAAWPDIESSTIRLAFTIPQFASGIMMMVTGAIVGKKISYRAACIGGSLLIAIPQLVSFVWCPSWSMFLVLRAIMGIGLGLYGGRTALLALTTPKEVYNELFGYCNAAMKTSAIIMPIIVGYLAKISWKHPLLINIVPILTAIIMYKWMEEPEKVETEETKINKVKAKVKIPYQIWLVLIVIFFFGAAKYGSWAEYGQAYGIENATVMAGYAQSVQNVAGLIAVLFYGPITKKLGKATLWVAYLGLIANFVLMIFVKNAFTMVLGGFLWGFFYTLHFTTQQIISSNVANDESKALCTSLILGCPLFFNLVTNGFAEMYHGIFKMDSLVASGMTGSIICYAICLVICVVTGLTKFTGAQKSE